MRKVHCLLLALAIGMTGLNAQTGDCPHKVDPKLWNKLAGGASAEFLLILREQADVRDAVTFRTKEEKGRYVYETLLETAERTQGPVRANLRDAGAPLQSFWIINGLWSKGSADLVAHLAEMPEIDRIEDNPVWHISLLPQDATTTPGERTMTPASWGLTKIKADQVWTMGYTGSGVVVGGQDTGYEWQHPAIKEKYRGWNGSSADHNYNWHDAIHALINGGSNSCGLNLTAPCDDDNHGTHTVGTMVGAETVNNVIGVAPDAKWIGCRNMEEGDGTPATYIECFEWLAAPTNLSNTNANPAMAPAVINNSWGCPPSEGCNSTNFNTMQTVVNNVKASGILVVTSAGNSGPNCSTVDDPPSMFSASFAVGATNSSDVIATFSSRGPVTFYNNLMKPNISAPGVSINSCIGNSNNSGTYNYASWNGTSMAGPHVAGVAALVLSARPDLIGQVDVLENLLEGTALPRYATAPFCGNDNASSIPNNVYGYGRVDALAAVNAALSLPVELVSFTAEAEGPRAMLRWTTATETNCAFFQIQRSADAIHWENLGQLPCAGNSSQLRDYQFTDNQPLDGLNYYRLRQVDFSGAYLYSPIASLRFGNKGVRLLVTARPGQQQAFLEVRGGSPNERWRVSVHSVDGRELYSARLEQTLAMPLPGLAHGIYLVWLHDARGSVVDVQKMAW